MIPQSKINEWSQSPETFRNDLMIEVSGSVRRWGDCMDPWQRADFAALDPGLRIAAGQAPLDDSVKMRSYWERPRGHSKTTDLAAIALWFLIFATGIRKGIVVATDRDVADLTREAILKLIRLNPMLAEIIDVQKEVVVNKLASHPGCGSELRILTSDVASSWGLLVDLIIADELTHWQGDGSLWASIVSTAGKKLNCLMLVIANAGVVDSWQYKVREEIRNFGEWIFSRLDGVQASWMTEKMLDEQRRLLPKIHFDRVWRNLWAASGGDALPPEVIDLAFPPEATPMTGGEDGWLFVAGLDLGLTRDNAALVVLAVPDDGNAGKIRLAYNKLWQPTPNVKIDLIAVEKHLLEIDRQYNLEYVAFDPWQAEHLAQTLEADTDRHRRNARRVHSLEPWMRAIPPVAANLRQQATLTIEFFNDRRVSCYDCEPLRRDLKKLRVEEKSYGCRLVSPRDGSGHGDTFSAFALALLIAHEVAGKHQLDMTPINPGEVSPITASSWEERLAAYQEQRAKEEEWLAEYREANGFSYALRTGQLNWITPNRF